MSHHILKLREEFWDAVMNGEKTFEVRYNDRGFQRGDTVTFVNVDKNGAQWGIEGDKRVFDITYVLNGYGLDVGHVVFSIKPHADSEET